MRSDTTPAGPRDLPAVLHTTWSRIGSLVAGLPERAGDRALPTVDHATVNDVFAHLRTIAMAAAADPRALCRGALAPPTAGAAGVDSSLPDLVTEWTAANAGLLDAAASNPDLTSFLITDAVMCEHDLRTALDTPGARDDLAVKVSLDELAGRFSDRVTVAQLPPLRVTVEQWGTIAGTGRATACVVADRFELVRGMSGRRSGTEILRWNWGSDPGVYLPVIAEVDPPAHEIRERDPRIPEHMRDREFVL